MIVVDHLVVGSTRRIAENQPNRSVGPVFSDAVQAASHLAGVATAQGILVPPDPGGPGEDRPLTGPS